MRGPVFACLEGDAGQSGYQEVTAPLPPPTPGLRGAHRLALDCNSTWTCLPSEGQNLYLLGGKLAGL